MRPRMLFQCIRNSSVYKILKWSSICFSSTSHSPRCLVLCSYNSEGIFIIPSEHHHSWIIIFKPEYCSSFSGMWYVSDVRCDEYASKTQECKNSCVWIPHKKAKGLVGSFVLKVFVRQSSHPDGLVTFVPLFPSVRLLLTDVFNLCTVDQGVKWWVLKDNELEPWPRSRCNRNSKMSACTCSSSSSLLITYNLWPSLSSFQY